MTTYGDTANGDDFANPSFARDSAADEANGADGGGGRFSRSRLRQRRQAKQARKAAAKVVSGLGRQLKQVALLGVYGKGPEIGSLASARQLARKLFDNLERGQATGGRAAEEPVLVVEDFIPVRDHPPAFTSSTLSRT